MVSSSKRRGISIRMFLADGTPDGLKLVEKSNWNGLAVMCARADYPEVRGREQFARPGVYVLISPSPDLVGRQSLYIGQADRARERLDQHLKGKDDWTHVILFVSRDTTLNKAHVQYLESRLIELAQSARRADLTNGNAPGRPFLSEADQADADAFLDDMLIIYPILGVTAFETHSAPLPLTPRRPELPSDPSPVIDPPIEAPKRPRLYLKIRGVEAQGEDAAEGFIVFAGSTARVQPVPSIERHPYLIALRAELKKTGVLVPENGVLRFTQDYRFSSPSTAGGVLIGGAISGRVEWKDFEGRTLKSLQEAALEGPITDVS